jgi:hypothetical protein
MEALLDNDLLRKLTRYDLLFEFERLLALRGCVQPHGRVGTALYSLRLKSASPPASHWPDARQGLALREFILKRSHGVTGAQAEALTRLNIDAFDPGEVTLVAYALEHPTAVIFTGDKRCLRALATHPSLAPIAATLTGRCVHLESVMKTLSARLGWRRIASAVIAATGEDIALERIYSHSSEAAMKAALDKNIALLAAETDTLIAQTF